MSDKKNISSRRNTIRKVFQSAGYFGLGGLMWGAYLDKAKGAELVLRPPGAVDEEKFIKACSKCGTCVEACPYDTLKVAKPQDKVAIGTPYFIPRDVPCYMCPDVPCLPACPTGALDIGKLKMEGIGFQELDINKSKMGIAVVDENSCIAFKGIQCDACYRACPLLGEAITLKYQRSERTDKPAFSKPVVIEDVCTGCGMCEHACVTEKAAIKILPREIALGKVGEHFINGWDEADEKRLKNLKPVKEKKENVIPAEDYLNNWEDLMDD